MKQFVLKLMLFTFFISCNEKPIPQAIKMRLFELEPSAHNVQWFNSKGIYKVYYTLNERKTTSYFDTKGNWLETESEIQKEDLAQPILEVLATRLHEYSIIDIELVKTSDNQILYEVDLEKEGKIYDILFDETGRILRKKI